MTWYLTVKTKSSGDLMTDVGDSEDAAKQQLETAKGHVGKSGVVTIADKIVVQAHDILAVTIHEAM